MDKYELINRIYIKEFGNDVPTLPARALTQESGLPMNAEVEYRLIAINDEISDEARQKYNIPITHYNIIPNL